MTQSALNVGSVTQAGLDVYTIVYICNYMLFSHGPMAPVLYAENIRALSDPDAFVQSSVHSNTKMLPTQARYCNSFGRSWLFSAGQLAIRFGGLFF